MDNQKVIEKLLKEYNLQAQQQAKQSISDFAILYAQKLIRKCIKINGKVLNLASVRNSYEILNKIHSPQYEEELRKRKEQLIKAINQQQIKEEDFPKSVNTVKLHFKNKLEIMRTNRDFQIAFDS